jgi:hypothetical protein
MTGTARRKEARKRRMRESKMAMTERAAAYRGEFGLV